MSGFGNGAARTGVVAFEGLGARGRPGMWILMGMAGGYGGVYRWYGAGDLGVWIEHHER